MRKQSDVAPTDQFGPNDHQLINRQILARAVGYLAMALPFALFAVGYFMSCAFDTISHYYYGPFSGSLFVGALAAVALVLFAYSGKTKSETRMASLAAIALLVVAFVPTQNVGCEKSALSARVFVSAELGEDRSTVVLKPFRGGGLTASQQEAAPVEAHFQWAEGAVVIHTLAAGVFILVLAYFCFAIFTKVDAEHLKVDGSGALTDEKATRNGKYRQSGWVIIFCLAALVMGLFLTGDLERTWDDYNGTFLFESIAIVAFARSWLLKGRAAMYRDLADKNEVRVRAICEGRSPLQT